MSFAFVCPVCGYPELGKPPRDENGCASFEICPCCGIEFGYEDATRSHTELRADWVAAGCRWWANPGPPVDWNARRQLVRAGFGNVS